MQIINDLQQGTPEWHAHRAAHFNASDCAAMLGISPYKTRDELLREKATGLVPEVDAATQRRFDEGHRFEALARPIAEAHIGEELYPCVGVLEGTKLSASFDGMTIDGSIVWEHKLMSDKLEYAITHDDVPEHYHAQMEQQLLVSGAGKVVFMASEWDTDGNLIRQAHREYTTNPALRQRIIDGWAQFEKDLAEYQAQPLPPPKPTGKAPESLPALHIQATGKVLASNLDTFKQQAFAVLDSINRDLQTDDDFANAEITVKWCKDVEKQLDAAWQHVLSQTVDIAAVEKTIKDVIAHTRTIRLELEKLTRAEKENRKLELVERADKAIFDHCQSLNARLAGHDDALGFACVIPQSFEPRRIQLAAAIKGLRTLESMQSALNTVVAEHKIAADAEYRRVEANIKNAWLARDMLYLFPDMQGLIETKPADDLQNLITARIAEAECAERERQERERKEQELAEALGEACWLRDARAEEAESAESERRKAEGWLQLRAAESTLRRTSDTNPQVQKLVPSDNEALLKLGDINAAIAPLSITADGLKQFGFEPVATDKSAKLYRARALETMLRHMAHHLTQVANQKWRAAELSKQAA